MLPNLALRLSINVEEEERVWHQTLMMRQIFYTLRVNCIHDTGLFAEGQRPTFEQWWFVVQVACGAAVIQRKLKSHLASKSSLQIRCVSSF